MMTHEVAIPIHGQSSLDSKTMSALKSNAGESLKVSNDDRRLPNGQKVDFGGKSSRKTKKTHLSKKSQKDKDFEKKTIKNNKASSDCESSDEKKASKKSNKRASGQHLSNEKIDGSSGLKEAGRNKKKLQQPSLPNGDKPNFHGEAPKANVDGNNSLEQSLPNGEKPNFNRDANRNKKLSKTNGKSSALEDTYAGSSFHSSPAALNLPKPTFKASPKQLTLQPEIGPSNGQLRGPPQHSAVSPFVVPATVPHSAPLIDGTNGYPLYQPFPNHSPGYNYSYPTNGGYIGQPIGIHPMMSNPYQQACPMPQSLLHPTQHPITYGSEVNGGAQKISFNDLLKLSKD
ncbi:uncharacterized protein PRCAT00001207001 [Priceomyces carsonii]|uniref:uncharacterized protein n=1 Tax=Priceomyces carsonii TaxID=28549 RepID=UPI002EDA6AE6|nr:unnamed protein product [Priceomyces carsonii]